MNLDIKDAKKEYFQNEIPEWYLNYSDGIPEFGKFFREELISFSNYKDQNLLNAVCLAVSVYMNAKDLTHDISQTMFNKDFEISRDECMSIICEALYDFSAGKNIIIYTPDKIETAIRVALAHCYYGSLTKEQQIGLSNPPSDNAVSSYVCHDILNFVGVVQVIGRLV